MAFAALHPEARRIDATLPDLGCGLSWDAVHKVRPRAALRCPDCGHGVHAKVSSRRLRYFAHDPGRPGDCAWLNESLEHHLLKLELATAIRDAGWHAELEVRAPDGSWRADVLASAHDGSRRVAFEAQLSPITDDDITTRTSRYQSAGIDVCWVSAGNWPPWMEAVPLAWVRAPGDGQPWTVSTSVARFDYTAGAWCFVGVELTQFVSWVLVHAVRRRYRRIRVEPGKSYVRRKTIWTTPRSIGEEDRHEAMRQGQGARKPAPT
jgi:competence protein CoiA